MRGGGVRGLKLVLDAVARWYGEGMAQPLCSETEQSLQKQVNAMFEGRSLSNPFLPWALTAVQGEKRIWIMRGHFVRIEAELALAAGGEARHAREAYRCIGLTLDQDPTEFALHCNAVQSWDMETDPMVRAMEEMGPPPAVADRENVTREEGERVRAYLKELSTRLSLNPKGGTAQAAGGGSHSAKPASGAVTKPDPSIGCCIILGALVLFFVIRSCVFK